MLIFPFISLGLIDSCAYKKQSDGVLLQIAKQKETDARLLKIQVCSENIIRIMASAEKSFSTRPSLMVDKTNGIQYPGR